MFDIGGAIRVLRCRKISSLPPIEGRSETCRFVCSADFHFVFHQYLGLFYVRTSHSLSRIDWVAWRVLSYVKKKERSLVKES
ncbi:hypothetical protein U1Q18_038683 [Sarracenia purpurea var. burkii]